MTKEEQIRDISKRLGLSHIGSNISILPILEHIYKYKRPQDLVVLDGAHAHLSHLLFTNPYNAEELIKEYGIHCDRKAGCDSSGGSLAHSGIALGLAIGNPDKKVYLIMTDGSLGEGSAWESLRTIVELKLQNIEVHVNLNGYTATQEVDKDYLKRRLIAFYPQINIWETSNGEGLDGLKGHYQVL